MTSWVYDVCVYLAYTQIYIYIWIVCPVRHVECFYAENDRFLCILVHQTGILCIWLYCFSSVCFLFLSPRHDLCGANKPSQSEKGFPCSVVLLALAWPSRVWEQFYDFQKLNIILFNPCVANWIVAATMLCRFKLQEMHTRGMANTQWDRIIFIWLNRLVASFFFPYYLVAARAETVGRQRWLCVDYISDAPNCRITMYLIRFDFSAA